MSNVFGRPNDEPVEGADELRVGPRRDVRIGEKIIPDERASEDVRPPVEEAFDEGDEVDVPREGRPDGEKVLAERPPAEDVRPRAGESNASSGPTAEQPGELEELEGVDDSEEPELPGEPDAFENSVVASAAAPPPEPETAVAPAEEREAVAVPEAPAAAEHAPGELRIPDGVGVFIGSPNGTRRSVGIAVSSFNGDITTRLLEGALEALAESGVDRARVDVMRVPGAFELPLAAMALAKTRRYACVLALGCIIRGDTPHFEYVAGEAASGLQLAALETGVPVAFGVLTCDSRMQAESRAGGRHGNKGVDAARSALEMADVFARLRTDAVVADRR